MDAHVRGVGGKKLSQGPSAKLTLSGKLGQPTRGPVIALVDPTNNLPTS
jgi:hypothetical protein